MIRRAALFVLGVVAAASQGCAVVGQSVGALGQLVDLAISLAMAALPFALAYYLYRRDEN